MAMAQLAVEKGANQLLRPVGIVPAEAATPYRYTASDAINQGRPAWLGAYGVEEFLRYDSR